MLRNGNFFHCLSVTSFILYLIFYNYYLEYFNFSLLVEVQRLNSNTITIGMIISLTLLRCWSLLSILKLEMPFHESIYMS